MAQHTAQTSPEKGAPQIKIPTIQSNKGATNGSKKPDSKIVATDLSQLADIKLPPVITIPTINSPKHNVGYVLESGGSDDNNVDWTKVLVKLDKGWTTGIIQKPTVLLKIGTVIRCNVTPAVNPRGKKILAITNVVADTEESIVTDLYRFLLRPDNQSEHSLKLIYTADLATALMESLPLKGSMKDFLTSQGIDYIVGQITVNQFIVKLLK